MAKHHKRGIGGELLIAAAMIVSGVAIIGFAFVKISTRDDLRSNAALHQMAQTTQTPPQNVPAKETAPAESMPGGTRPTTPAPEPARPDSEAQKAGATPALPPAPPEKIGEPIPERK